MVSVQLKEKKLEGCPICGAPFGGDANSVNVRDPFGVSDQKFTLVECESCSTYVLNPRPSMDEMGIFYEDGFLKEETEDGDSLLVALADKQQEFNLISELRWLDHHLKDGARYLDYSAGNGQIVTLLRRRRADLSVSATEFSLAYRERIGGLIGSERVKAGLDDFPVDAEFDLISAFGVLEHVEDPEAMLASIAEKLSEGGKVMLSVPNIESFQKKIMGRRWYSWVAPRHWHLMPMPVLRGLLEKHGFDVIEEKHFFLRTSSSTFALSLFPTLDPLLKPPGWKMLIYGMLFYLLIPLELVSAVFSRAGFMGVVAARRGNPAAKTEES